MKAKNPPRTEWKQRQAACGDATVLAEICAEICVELFAEGVGETVIEGAWEAIATNHDLFMEAARATGDTHEGAMKVKKNMKKLQKTLAGPSS